MSVSNQEHERGLQCRNKTAPIIAKKFPDVMAKLTPSEAASRIDPNICARLGRWAERNTLRPVRAPLPPAAVALPMRH
jgi:hypothetical protein